MVLVKVLICVKLFKIVEIIWNKDLVFLLELCEFCILDLVFDF